MYLVTCEDSEGMWVDDPIAADTEEEAKKIALSRWSNLPEGIAIVLWHCTYMGEIERPTKEQLMSASQ